MRMSIIIWWKAQGREGNESALEAHELYLNPIWPLKIPITISSLHPSSRSLRLLLLAHYTHSGRFQYPCSQLSQFWQSTSSSFHGSTLVVMSDGRFIVWELAEMIDDHWQWEYLLLRPNFVKLKCVNSSPSTRSSVVRRCITQGLWVIKGSSIIRRTREHL